MEGVLVAIESSALASALRGSTFVYPVVSALHILGIALLVGSILSFDIRAAGLWRGAGWREGMGTLVPVAAVGLGLAILTGGLLFAVRATDYANNPAMLVKIGIIGAGLVNVGVFHALLAQDDRNARQAERFFRLLSLLSMFFWVAALFAGRWIAFAG